MINNYIQFISNNVKGLESLEERIKVCEYLKRWVYVSSRHTLHYI